MKGKNEVVNNFDFLILLSSFKTNFEILIKFNVMNKIVLVLASIVLISCAHYKKMSSNEVKMEKIENVTQQILQNDKNIITVHERLNSKQIYVDNKGMWNVLQWENQQYRKRSLKNIPKLKLTDEEIENVIDEIRYINSNAKTITDTAYVEFQFNNATYNRPIYYESGNVKKFKQEKFNSPYLQAVQKILDL